MATAPAISGHTHLITLIGKPTDHSMSPAIHTYSFAKCGVDAVYLAFDNELEAIPDILNAMRQSVGWDGANVTMPYKQAVVEHLDGLSEAAEIMGAVSVIVKNQEGKLIGHNADGAGFIGNLRRHGVAIEGATMTLLGPGGAGGAILVQAALDGMKKINVFARRGGKSYGRAEALIQKTQAATGCEISLHAFEDIDDLKACINESQILANATNVGMGKDCTDSPVPADFLRGDLVVADAIYLPVRTQLLQDAEAVGAQTITGIGMLVEQGAVGERVWYGIEMPVDEVIAMFFAETC